MFTERDRRKVRLKVKKTPPLLVILKACGFIKNSRRHRYFINSSKDTRITLTETVLVSFVNALNIFLLAGGEK